MEKNLRKFELLTQQLQYGFLLVKSNDVSVTNEIISFVCSCRKVLLIDFTEHENSAGEMVLHGTDHYNSEIKTSKYDCVVFCNLAALDDPELLLENLNLNRDNFREQHLLYVFILPTFLTDYFRNKTPNLKSYVTGYFDFCSEYGSPFESLLSLGSLAETPIKVPKEQNCVPVEATSYRSILDSLAYCKLHGTSIVQMQSLWEKTKYYFKEDSVKESVVINLAIDFATVAFKKKLYSVVTEVCSFLLQRFLSNPHFPDSQTLLRALEDQLECLVENHDLMQLVSIVRLYASSIFCTADYQSALQYFSFARRILDTNLETLELYDEYCSNLSDVAFCQYKLAGNSWSNDFNASLDEILHIRSKASLSVKVQFVLDFNELLYRVLSGVLSPADYQTIKDKIDYFAEKCGKRSPEFLNYLSLASWCFGYCYGRLDEALVLSSDALELKYSVFTENHYSIAESCYCNGVFLLMQGELAKSRRYFEKASSILSNTTDGSERLLRLVSSSKIKFLMVV